MTQPWSNQAVSLIIIQGGGSGTGFFLYNGTPGPGNPPVLWAVPPGVTADPFGTPVAAVLGAGNPGGAQTQIDASGDIALTGAAGSSLDLMPSANLPFAVTSGLTGIMQSLISLGSGDSSQTQAGIASGITLGTGAAAKMGTLIASPYGSTPGSAVLLLAENDGGTDVTAALIGTVSTQGGTVTFTPVGGIYPGGLVLYSGGGAVNVVTKTSGSGTIPIPANAASTAVGESWGIAGSGGGAGGSANFGGGGGGGGSYGQEPALAITPGGTASYVVPTGHGTGAGATTLTGAAVTVTGNPGADGSTGATGTGGAGGAASGNTIAFAGGHGGNGFANGGGGGGGSSAGPSGAGGNGQNGRAHGGGTGGSGGSGTGRGGAGAGPGNNGSPGGSPGGGGGGSGVDVPGGGAGGAAGGAQARITFNVGAFTVLSSIASAAFTDIFSNAIPAGGHLTWPDGNLYSLGKSVAEASAGTTINSLSNIPIAGTARAVVAGTYLIRGQVHGTNGGVGATQAVAITAPAASHFNVEIDVRSATANSYKAFGEVTSPGGRVGTGALAAGEVFVATYSGIVTFTASGTVQLGGSCVTAAGDTWTADVTSFLVLEPI